MGEIKGGHGEEERRMSPVGRRGGGGWELALCLSSKIPCCKLLATMH
jgi:hypothetical protein